MIRMNDWIFYGRLQGTNKLFKIVYLCLFALVFFFFCMGLRVKMNKVVIIVFQNQSLLYRLAHEYFLLFTRPFIGGHQEGLAPLAVSIDTRNTYC